MKHFQKTREGRPADFQDDFEGHGDKDDLCQKFCNDFYTNLFMTRDSTYPFMVMM